MRWIKHESVIWEELDGGALLIDTQNGSRWTLSAAAAAAWKLCDGTHTLAEMTRMLRQHQNSIAEFCWQFETLGLLHCRDASHPELLVFRAATTIPFSFQFAGLGANSRRRPSPRGNSGPG